MTARHNIGDNVQVRENADGEAVIEHKPSGKTVKLNGDGAETEAFRTEKGRTEVHTYGYDYQIWRDADYIYVHDRTGELVYGGPDAVGVSNPDDFGEILQETINNHHGDHPAVRLAPGDDVEDGNWSQYMFRTTANIDKVFALWGPGRNRVIVSAAGGFDSSEPCIRLNNPEPNQIFRIDSVKFSGGGADCWINATNVVETIFTHCEFKNISPAIRFDDVTTGYNAFIDCWFLPLDSGDVAIDWQGHGGLTMFGNRIDGGDVILEDVDPLHRSGNIFRSGEDWQLTNVTTHRNKELPSNISFNLLEDPADTTSDTYESVAELGGSFDISRVPDGSTLYGRFRARAANIPDGETAHYRPVLRECIDTGGDTSAAIHDLEVEATGNGEDTGWVEITEASLSFDNDDRNFYIGESIEAQVTGGTLESRGRHRFGLSFEWR